MLYACPCGSAYSVGAPRCPECGLDCDAATERDDYYMARVTVHGGVTDVNFPQPPKSERSEDVSLGNSLSPSSAKLETTSSKNEPDPPSRAGKTESHSSKGRKGHGTAGSAGASTRK